MKGKRPSIEASLTECEELLRAGEPLRAARILRRLRADDVPPNRRAVVANLARRAGLLKAAFRVLYHGGQPAHFEDWRPDERAEYAVALTLVGGSDEAFGILASVSERTPEPSLLFAKAWCYFDRWEHALALPLLTSAQQIEGDPYRRIAGAINLAEAYGGANDPVTARMLLDEAIVETELRDYRRLQANALHLRARIFFETSDLRRSDQDLARARSLFGGTGTTDALLIERQIAINSAFRLGSPLPLHRFRARARRAGAYEDLREIDFQSLRLQHDEKLLRKIFLGTPFPAYRERLRRTYGDIAVEKGLSLGRRSPSFLDLATGEARRGEERKIVLARQNLTLARALARDLYVPPSVGGIFHALFPDESFNYLTSPPRVRQALRRLRTELSAEGLPLKLRCRSNRYRLAVGPGFRLRLDVPALLRDRPPSDQERLRAGLGAAASFTGRQARALLGHSRSTTLRLLDQLIREGVIERVGRGKNAVYLFAQPHD